MKSAGFFFVAAAMLLMAGCGRRYNDQPAPENNTDKMVEVSRAVVHDEAQSISAFISRHGWKMNMTGSGLRYEIYQEGKGRMANQQSVLTIAYQVFLLDGTLCYEATEAQPLKLVTGKGDQVNGLEEGLMLMQEGSKARFILPNHLAYGLTGDQNKIPPASALYYDVHLVKIETPKGK